MAQDTEAKRNYRSTLNLPRTAFPMKANLVQNEPESLKRWQKMNLYARVQRAHAADEPFVFHDGPPYANASIHLGHVLNKCLKDFVVRSRLMSGRACPYVPGWDCHGLPIEHKVMTDMVESGRIAKLKELDDDARRMAIRRECKKHAEKFIRIQAEQMQRLLTVADYDHPYLTMHPSYEGATLEVLAALLEHGLVYRALKPVHWSIENETALAEAELEYYDREDISVYVDFEAADASAVFTAFALEGDARPDQTPSFMIWTTTPWTLPANVAVAVHERYEYALVRMDGNLTVIAAELVDTVARAAGAEHVEELARITGAKLLGLRYRHPFVDRTPDFGGVPGDPGKVWTIVGADYVTLEDGTGLVHTATGHGAEDYMTGLKEDIPTYCPVMHDGRYDRTVPDWLVGMSVWDANREVTEHLRRSGHLFHDQTFTHSYPHDWRSKTPVIFRCTEQWFISVDRPAGEGGSLRQRALAATAEKIRFIPEWGRNRMRGMLESRPDWCISRQRSWGLPIPAFYLPDGSPFMTAASVRAVAQAVRAHGSDYWFTATPEELLGAYRPEQDPEKPPQLEIGALRKGQDIFDVWFESGSSWNSAMRERGLGFPVDLYLEGSDQHRGWFQLSMLPGLGMMGCSPFRSVLTHGFMVDKDGHKLSKSKGHTVEELFKEYGADVIRWWVSSLSYENDVKVDDEFFKASGESYRKVRNTLRFMLSNLGDFTPGADGQGGNGVDLKSINPRSIDAWALSEYDKVAATVLDAYERYDFQRAQKALYNFCNDTLSAVYLAAVKDRLYCDVPDSPRRRRTQTALWALTDGLCRLVAPILCHTADEAHRALWGAGSDDERCVHVQAFVPSLGVQADEAWGHAMAERERAMISLESAKRTLGVENPLDAGLVLPDPDHVLGHFDAVELADLMCVSRVEVSPDVAEPKVQDLRGEPRCERSWKRDGTVRERSDGGWLSDRDAAALGVN